MKNETADAWKALAIGQREQIKFLEDYIDMRKACAEASAEKVEDYDFDLESLEIEVENGRERIELLAHNVRMWEDYD